ncbi:MAG TPA: CoA-binding protein [Phycisphaerae bacterium]|nr:CoA-binding protein [Phycisphaerae bacterium]
MRKRTVAVVGASTDRAKYGNKSVRAHRQQGWEVYPVHPTADAIEGLKAYASLRDVPVRVNRVSLYLPPDLGLEVLPDIAKAGPEEFFVNPGAESEELVAAATRLGLEPILACSIVDLGVSPAQFPDD